MADHVHPPGTYSGTDEFCHRSGGCAHLEWPLLETPPVLGQIGDQTAIPLHSFDDGLPGLTAEFPAMQEYDGLRFDRTGFPRKQIHVIDPSTGSAEANCV
jgi:hypothetical protein